MPILMISFSFIFIYSFYLNVPQVCGHICKCYSVAAQFEECREKIIELPNIIRDLCRILYYGKVRMLSTCHVDFILSVCDYKEIFLSARNRSKFLIFCAMCFLHCKACICCSFV